MEQRDIIKDEIEQLGRVLGKILADFIGLRTKGNVSEAIEITNQRLQTELDLDIDKLMRLESHELEEYVESLKLTDKYLDQLSTYLFEIGIYKKTDENKKDSLKYFKSAKKLLELVDEKSKTITFDRINLKAKIEKELQ